MTHKLGALILDIEGTALSAEDKEILSHPLVGGVILFARNFTSRTQLKNLCTSIRAARAQPLLIMVDQEGGRVQRFIDEFTRLPYMNMFGQLYDVNPDDACSLAKACGQVMASELLSVNIDLSLAPVLDLDRGISTVIGKRAFHSDPDIVVCLAAAFIAGMKEAGMAATGKHFPGHGSVMVDSHLALPVDQRSLPEIEATDMLTFANVIKLDMPAIMAAHIIFPNVDPLPVSYSSVWLKDILRKRLGFNGVIFSDDLNMQGANISANYAERVAASREAGCDFALVCNNRPGAMQVLNQLSAATHWVSEEKYKTLASNFTSMPQPLPENTLIRKLQELSLEQTHK